MLKFDKKTFSLIFELKNFENNFQYKLLKSKNEYHITLIGYKTGQKLKKLLNSKRLAQLENLIKNFDFNYKILDNYFLIQKNDKNSVIQIVESENIENFYKNLNSIFWTSFPIPFLHITIFWDWIGLYSQKDFNDLNPAKLDF